jgi:hypothetical protein
MPGPRCRIRHARCEHDFVANALLTVEQQAAGKLASIPFRQRHLVGRAVQQRGDRPVAPFVEIPGCEVTAGQLHGTALLHGLGVQRITVQCRLVLALCFVEAPHSAQYVGQIVVRGGRAAVQRQGLAVGVLCCVVLFLVLQCYAKIFPGLAVVRAILHGAAIGSRGAGNIASGLARKPQVELECRLMGLLLRGRAQQQQCGGVITLVKADQAEIVQGDRVASIHSQYFPIQRFCCEHVTRQVALRGQLHGGIQRPADFMGQFSHGLPIVNHHTLAPPQSPDFQRSAGLQLAFMSVKLHTRLQFMSNAPLRIFIGYDHRQAVSYNVLQFSILRRATRPIAITPIVLPTLPLTRMGLTPFTYSRFLVPWLCDFRGWALFLDLDYLCLADISELFALADDRYAAMVSKNVKKFEWASAILFNCAHPANGILTPEHIQDAQRCRAPHGLDWLPSELVGDLPREWNHLVGYDSPRKDARLVHYTQGMPVFEETKGSEYTDEWMAEHQASSQTQGWQELMANSIHAANTADGKRVAKLHPNALPAS